MPTLGRLRYLDALPGANARPRGTLLLIHGFPLNSRMWEGQLEFAAARGWRVIAPDLGTSLVRLKADATSGNSGVRLQPDPTIDDYAAEVIDLLDGLHIEGAVVGGVSMGGYVTFAVCRHAARYVRGLILADTRSQADTPEGVEGRKKMLQLLKDQGPAAIADQMIPKLIGETSRRTRPGVADQLRAIIMANSAEVIGGAINALMTRPDATPLLASIHVPTLVVVGAEDALTPPSMAEDLHREIAGSQLEVIAGAGHMPNMERPDAFNEALASFLDHRV
ncbi:MAG: alpha/beta hydrolase [Acidobacteriia bacterium]|nr:alpha/beta hydrolase [Terriglobia bacterium]